LQSSTVRTLPFRVFVSTMLNHRLLEILGFNGVSYDDRVITSSGYTVEVVGMLTVCRSEPLPV
jgi:hypothetical protein